MKIHETTTVLYIHLEDLKLSTQKAHSERFITINDISFSDLGPEAKTAGKISSVVILKIGKNVKLLKTRY